MKQKKKFTKKNLFLMLFIMSMTFISLGFSSVYSQESSPDKTEKFNFKLSKIEKSNLDEKEKLEKSNVIYKNLALSEPDKYLTAYLKSAQALREYYNQNCRYSDKYGISHYRYKTESLVNKKETIKIYEKIISKNPQLVNKEAMIFYDDMSHYYYYIHQPSVSIQLLDEGLKQTNYLLGLQPNDLDLLKMKNSLLSCYLSTSTYNNTQSGNLDKCSDIYQQLFENDKQLILNGYATFVLTNNLRSYSNLMVKNYNFTKANEKYDEYINYFRKLSYTNPKYKKNYADLLISKNYSLYAKLSDREIEYNFNEAKNILIKSYDLSTIDGMKQFYRDLQEISYIYESHQEHQKAENALLQGLSIYNRYTYPEMEQTLGLTFWYLRANEDLIKFYKRNQQKEKAEKSIAKFKDACSYFAQKDEKNIRQMESCNNILLGHDYYFN